MRPNRNHPSAWLAVVLALAASIAFSAAVPASVERLHSTVSWLADPARQGRRAGTTGAADAANYIAAQFRESGYEVQFQEFGGNRRNVIARLGSASNVIVAGAHYDGQGLGYPSASDNAAGVAVLLEIARDLQSAKLPVTLLLIAFDDEEQGLNGSRYFADHPTVPLDSIESAIVFDALGRRFLDLKEWTTIVLGTEYSAELASIVRKQGGKDLFNIGTDLIGPRSDFAPFASRRIPFLLFSDGTYIDYHGKGDTADRIDYVHLADEAGIIGSVIRDIASLKMKPVYRTEPIYPMDETMRMLKLMASVRAEKKDLSLAYRLVFDDLKTRIPMDSSRESIRMATNALLVVATPAHARFFLDVELEPYYEMLKKQAIVTALREESARSGS